MRVRQIQIKNLNSKDHKQCESQKTLTYPITMYKICLLFYNEKVFKKCLGNYKAKQWRQKVSQGQREGQD